MKRLFSALLLLVALSLVLPTAFADPGQPGPYAVGFTYSLVVDPNRDTGSGFSGRPVAVYLWYPVDSGDIHAGTPEAVYPMDPYFGWLPPLGSSILELYGLDRAYAAPNPSSDAPFPLVMFSPGWGAPALFHLSNATRLASHGFVVAILTHYGDGILPWDPFHHLAVASLNRPRDLSFALDHLLQKNGTPADLVYGTINPGQVAAAGWSLGGYASMTLSGGDDLVCDSFNDPAAIDEYGPPPNETCVATSPDPRFKAIVPLDGSNQLLRFYELARIKTPTIGIGQEFEKVQDWQARQHAAIPAHPSYRVDLNESTHASFSNACEAYQLLGDMGLYPPETVAYLQQRDCTNMIAPPLAHQLVNKYMIAFLKTHLVGETGYQRMLTPGWALTREPNIEFFVTEKKNPNAISEDWPEMFIYFPNQSGSATAKAHKDPATLLRIPHAGLMNPPIK